MATKWLWWHSATLIVKFLAQSSSEKIIPDIDRNKYRDVQRARDRGPLGPNWDVSINSLPSRFRESCERGRRTLRGRGRGGHQGNTDYSAQQDWHTYALTEDANTAACVRACAGLDLTGFRFSEWKWTQTHTPSPGVISNWCYHK